MNQPLRVLANDGERTYRDVGDPLQRLLGDCQAMRRVRARLELFAHSHGPVLVVGETGTGKELAASAIHHHGPDRHGPFVAVACGAIPTELVESELFGHVKGAFTGAVTHHEGMFVQAHGGTLVLDDVDDFPLESQVKLLRVLQEGVFRQVGGREDLHVDVRVVATTKVDLAQLVAQGRFREDLFYRLRGLEVVLPPLRERGDDVLLLTHHFLRAAAVRSGQMLRGLSPEAADVLRHHEWPGNVRELIRVLETAWALCTSDRITDDDLPDYLRTCACDARLYTLHLREGAQLHLPRLVEQFEQEVVRWAMQRAGGHQFRAAAILGIPRTTLQSKLTRAR